MCKILILAASFVLSCAQPAAAYSTAHWLTREPPAFQRAERDLYHAVVSLVFSDDSGVVGGCFQTVSLVGGKPEEIVYIECAKERGSDPVQIVHLVATESIERKLRVGGLEAATRIGVRRTETSMSSA